MKIRLRLFIVFLVSILASTILSAALLLYVQNRFYQKQMVRLHEDAMQSLRNNIVQLTGSVDRTSSVAFQNRLTQSVLCSVGEDGLTFENQTYIRDFLTLLIASGEDITSASFYDLKGSACYAVRDDLYLVTDVSLGDMPWYLAAVQADGDWIYESGSEASPEQAGEKIILTMIRQIKSRSSLAPIGYLQVNIDRDVFSRIFSGGSSTSACYQLLCNGEAVFSSGKPEKNKEAGAVRDVSLPMAGWSVRGEIPSVFFLSPENLTVIILLVLINISFLVLCWAATTRYVSRPLQSMSDTLLSQKSTESLPDGFDVRQSQQDEISILKQSFNDLLSSIRQLTEQREENARLLREKDLVIVTEQIRPHFLYNTLDTISGMILDGEYKSAFSMIQSLGQFYRTSLGSGEMSIPLSEELSVTSDYLQIMNFRFGQHFVMDIDIPEDLYTKTSHIKMGFVP